MPEKANTCSTGGCGSWRGEMILIAALFAIMIFTRLFIAMPVDVSGTSMYPTLKPKERYLVLKYPVWMGTGPKRGDIIVADINIQGDLSIQGGLVVKRVVGMPGDEIEVYGGTVKINGEILDEPYTEQKEYREGPSGEIQEISYEFDEYDTILKKNYVPRTETLKEDEYFILGDNRMGSGDSRLYGPIKKQDIKAILATKIR